MVGTVEKGDKLIAIGDSVVKRMGLDEFKVKGLKPSTIKSTGNTPSDVTSMVNSVIKTYGGKLSHHHIILSSGWLYSYVGTSEDYFKQLDAQISALKGAGAKTIILLGVPTNVKHFKEENSDALKYMYDVSNINSQLALVAQKHEVDFAQGYVAMSYVEGRAKIDPPYSYFTQSTPMIDLKNAFEKVGGPAPIDQAPSNQIGKGKDTVPLSNTNAGKTVDEVAAEGKAKSPRTIAEKLEYVAQLPGLIKLRAEFSRNRDKDAKNNKEVVGANDYVFNYNVENLIKGVSNTIDMTRGSGYPSMAWLKASDTVEDANLVSKLNDNWINSFTGHCYPDLRFEEAFGHDSETLRKKSPTFFIKSQPLMTQAHIEDYIQIADGRGVDQVREVVKKGIMDSLVEGALDSSVETNKLNETDIGSSNIAAVINSEMSQKNLERRYLPEEGVKESEVKPKEAPAGTSGDGSIDETGSAGSTSNYSGDFPPHIKKWLGSVQLSQGLNPPIAAGYPAPIRALADLISRFEGTHPVKNKAQAHNGVGIGYRSYAHYAKTLNLNGVHPDEVIEKSPRSSAAGLYQFMGKNVGSWNEFGGKGSIMSVKNQDKAYVNLLKAPRNGIYNAVLKEDWKTVFSKSATRGKYGTWSVMSFAWASFPGRPGSTKGPYGQAKTSLKYEDCIEAAKILTNFYSQVQGAGAPASSTQVNNSTGKGLIDTTLSPNNLETNGRTFNVTVPKFDNDYLKDFKAGKTVTGLNFVDAIYANKLLFKSDLGQPVIVTLAGTSAAEVKVDVEFEDTSFLMFANKKLSIGKHQYYGYESREAVIQMLRGKKVTLTATSGAANSHLAEVTGTISYGNVSDFGLALIVMGAVRPSTSASKTYKDEGKKAENAKKGVWAYRTSAVGTSGWVDYTPAVNKAQVAADQNRINTSSTPSGNSGMRTTKLKESKPDIVVKDSTAEAAAKKAGGNVSLGTASNLTADSRPMRAAREATKGKEPSSLGRCAKYVRLALARAGYKTPGHPPHADDYHNADTLKKWGFVQISFSNPIQIGDIMVIKGGPWNNPASKSWAGDHLPGHIQIHVGNNRWTSDYEGGPNAYRKKGVKESDVIYALYRDKDYLNGAQPIEKKWEPFSLNKGGAQISTVIDGESTPQEDYIQQANALGVYPDLSAYTPEQIRGHSYGDIDFEESLEDGERFTVFSKELRKEKFAKIMAHNFSKGLDLCFPVVKAYVIIGNEDDDFFVQGQPINPAIYYELPPIQSFHLETNNDFNPLDVCTFSVINPSSVRSLADQHTDIGLAYNPDEVNTQYFNPVLLEKLRILPGMKIHIRGGYSNDPNKLIPMFNGTVKETSGSMERVIECVCESYANELLSQQLGYSEPTDFSGDHNASTGLLIAYALMSDNINHFGAQLGRLRTSQAWVGGIVDGATSIMQSAWDATVGETWNDIKDAQSAFANGQMEQALLSTIDALGLPASFLLPGGLAVRAAVAIGSSFLGNIGGGTSNTDEAMTYFANEKAPFAGLLLGGKGRAGDFRDPENKALVAPFSGGQFLWNMFNPSRANLSMRLFQNIFSDNIEQVHDTYRDTAYGRWFKGLLDWDIKVLYRFYVYRSTAWTVLKEMEYRHPGTLAKPLLYEERMTMFYGIKEQLYIARDLDPVYMIRAAYQNRHQTALKPYSKSYLKEREKRLEPATGYHFLSTQTNIISNNLKMNRDFATKATAVYFESKWFGMSEKTSKKSETILLSDSLSKFDIKESVVELGGCHGSYMAWLYATQELKKQIEHMYDGSIVVVGDPNIKAGNYAYLHDTDRGLKGTIKIKEASHHFSPTDGYVTIITPGLHAEASHFFWDDFLLRLNLASSIMGIVLTNRQDANLAQNEMFERYQDVLSQMTLNKNPSASDLMYQFGCWALLAGVSTTMMYFTVRTVARSIGLTPISRAYKVLTAYSKAGASVGWGSMKYFSRVYGAKVTDASKRIAARVEARVARGPDGKETVKALKEATSDIKKSRVANLVKKGPALIKKSWTAARFLRVAAAGAATLAMATPIGAAIAAVTTIAVEMALSWFVSKVRRAYLTHNAITFFPLDYSGNPFTAGVSGFSDRGVWEAAIYNLEKNAKILSKAGRAMTLQGTLPSGETDYIQSNLGATLQFLFSDNFFIDNLPSKIEADMKGANTQ